MRPSGLVRRLKVPLAWGFADLHGNLNSLLSVCGKGRSDLEVHVRGINGGLNTVIFVLDALEPIHAALISAGDKLQITDQVVIANAASYCNGNRVLPEENEILASFEDVSDYFEYVDCEEWLKQRENRWLRELRADVECIICSTAAAAAAARNSTQQQPKRAKK